MTSEMPPPLTTAPFSSTPLPSTAMLWSICASFLDSIFTEPGAASRRAELVGERAARVGRDVDLPSFSFATAVERLTPTRESAPLSLPGLPAAVAT